MQQSCLVLMWLFSAFVIFSLPLSFHSRRGDYTVSYNYESYGKAGVVKDKHSILSGNTAL